MTSLEQVKEVRDQGLYEQAFMMLARELKTGRTSPQYLLELLGLAILNGHIDLGLKIYRMLGPNLAKFSVGQLAAIYRLKNLCPEEDFKLFDNLVKNQSSNLPWYEEYVSSGQEKNLRPNIDGHSIRMSEGGTFFFKVSCPCCAYESIRIIRQSLCTIDSYLCALCFSRCVLDHQSFRQYFERMDFSGGGEDTKILSEDLMTLRYSFHEAPDSAEYCKLEQYLTDSWIEVVVGWSVSKLINSGQAQ